MKLLHYINPINIIKSIHAGIKDYGYYKKYLSIIEILDSSGELKRASIIKENDMLLIGVNLNPELLVYTEESITSAELKLVAERMKKYTAFLQKHGILDSIKADYERIKNDDYYGYLVNIVYDFRRYSKPRLIWDIVYLSTWIMTVITAVTYLISYIN